MNKKTRLGFGCMRLHDNYKEVIPYAIEHDICYFDIARHYCHGQCENLVKEALSGIRREEYILTSKLYLPQISASHELEKQLDISLKNLGVEYLDYCMLQAMDANSYQKMIELDCQSFFDTMIKKGKIRKAAFSFHDDFITFTKILDSYSWDMCQVQMNYLDIEAQAGIRGIQYANNKKIPVFVMGPLKGGMLTQFFNSEKANKDNLAVVAHKWLLSLQMVSLVVGSFIDINQIKTVNDLYTSQNCTLTDADLYLIETVREIYRKRSVTHCTNCRYCTALTSCDLPIHEILYDFDVAQFSDNYQEYHEKYIETNLFLDAMAKCIKCRKCIASCPQHIDILMMFKFIDKFSGIYNKRKRREDKHEKSDGFTSKIP